MKKKNYIIITILLLIFIFSYVAFLFISDREKEYKSEDGKISFYLSGFKNRYDTPYDLYFKSEDVNIGVFIYDSSDLDGGKNKLDYLNHHVETLMNKRDDSKELGIMRSIEEEDRIIYQRVVSAKRDGNDHIYSMNLIDFKDEDTFVYIIFSSLDEYGRNHLKDFTDTTKKVKLNFRVKKEPSIVQNMNS